jgi:hypothetical protein
MIDRFAVSGQPVDFLRYGQQVCSLYSGTLIPWRMGIVQPTTAVKIYPKVAHGFLRKRSTGHGKVHEVR